MKNTKSKALEVVNILKDYRGEANLVIDSYENIIKNSEEPVTLHYGDNCIGVLVGNFYYLYIFPDNTVRCNEDGWGRITEFEEDIFIKVMNI